MLRRQPAEVRRARGLARSAFQKWGMDASTDDAVLVVSELVSNAVRHGAGDTVTVELIHHDDRLRVTVCDDDTGTVTPHPETAHGEDGRGLRIVERISLDWGVDYLPTGKAVWAELCFP
jgi:anti-sigma regulatory factor (Ser/Thr protein kinase)